MPLTPEDAKINIVHQDDDIVVVNKPSGLLCVPGLKEPDNLFDRILSAFPNARVVHRLDMSTSGMVIFALNHSAQKNLGQMFEQKRIQKYYIAEVYGKLHVDYGEVICPLICDWERRPIQKIDWLEGKSAHTQFETLQRYDEQLKTRVRLTPITGRTHQLRLHMLSIGHPILGDAMYNLQQSQQMAERLLLHAQSLNFTHPISKKTISLFCPADF